MDGAQHAPPRGACLLDLNCCVCSLTLSVHDTFYGTVTAARLQLHFFHVLALSRPAHAPARRIESSVWEECGKLAASIQ
jgi:hypothetical protein